jgi:hypothetical protein
MRNGNVLIIIVYLFKITVETIRHGCGNFQESVKYSNFMCEYLKRILDLKVLNKESQEQLRQAEQTEDLKKNKNITNLQIISVKIIFYIFFCCPCINNSQYINNSFYNKNGYNNVHNNDSTYYHKNKY